MLFHIRFFDSFVIVLFLICSGSLVSAGHFHKEKVYQEAWCAKVGGVTEYRLADGTRVDCLTKDHAIEADFAVKWAESAGQALYYAERTGRQPGVLLIMENDDDDRYLERLNVLADKYGIKVWLMTPDDL